MSNGTATWPVVSERGQLLALLPIAARESRRRLIPLAALFAGIALCALALGVLLPKKYSAATTILVEQTNIIGPLMEGRAVPTGVANRAGIAREVAFSRRIMDEILVAGGWMKDKPGPLAQDKLIEDIIDRTNVSSPRDNLLSITYSDSDPARAFAVTKRFAELVIEESLATKERESRDAYAFIDSQVRLYHGKLTAAEADLERYRIANPDARPGIATDVNARISELRRLVETSRMDLTDLRSQQGALQGQLAGESEISMVHTRAGQFRARIAELQSERDRLLLTYTEQHPDVVRTQHQIRDLEEELRKEDVREASVPANTPGTVSASVAYNPLYGELNSNLADVRRRAAAAASRIGAGESLLQEELARSNRIAAAESNLAELTRDYEVNRDLYQDLLKRRENARVSMNLDAEQRGLSFRIQEPAAMPLRPSGLRLMHVAAAGLGLAVTVPLLMLLGLVKLDPRVRSPAQIEREAGLPVLGSIPVYRTRAAHAQRNRRLLLVGALLLVVPLAYGLVFALKLTHAL